MYSEEQQQAAIKQFKNQVQELIEAAKDSTAPVWMADLRAWQLRQTQKSLFKAISESETNRSQAAKELSRTKAILETVSAPIAPATSLSAPVTVAATKHILQDELAKYLAHKKSDWNKRSAIQAEANLLRFVEIIGTETNCEDITFDDIERYNTVMANLPPNAGKLRQKATLTTPDEIREFWELAATGNTGTKLLPNGIEKHYSVVRGFLKRLFITRRTDSDLAALLVISKNAIKNTSKKRSTFDTAALNKMFNSYIYSTHLRVRENSKSFHFWAPIIGLTTGMRIAEIASLEVADVREIEGVMCFDLNKNWSDKNLKRTAPDKSKKNESSVRLVPVPDVLWDIGLKKLIGKRKTGLLFSELRLSDTKGLGNQISRWFNEYFLRYAGIAKTTTNGEQLVFHSLRHTFTTLLDKTIVDGSPLKEELSHYVTGHTSGSVRSTVYNHGQNMAYIAKFMNAIEFGIDLSQLSYEKFLKRTAD